MAEFILSGLFLGGLIGTRLTVLALLPAAACTVGVAAIVAILGPHDWTALDVTALLVFLQIGYVFGAGLRMFVRPPRMLGERKHLRSS
jgi:hypothetical protein